MAMAGAAALTPEGEMGVAAPAVDAKAGWTSAARALIQPMRRREKMLRVRMMMLERMRRMAFSPHA